MLDLIGKSIGRFQILEELGRGGMAVVYKAFDSRLKTDVAVKVILVETLPQAEMERALKRFEREAGLLARLTHPNIVSVIDYGEFEGRPYLVMKYLPGGSLQNLLTGKPMAWQEASRLLIPVARALDYAHRQGAVHRDVKPANILITSDGEPMLTDFGIAKIIDEESTQNLTATRSTMGTPFYMAPEQINSKSVDGRADIYSLGIVFYELVTGRKPYTADTPMAVVIKHVREPLPDPKLFVPALPDSVRQMLQKALAKKPEDRYQSMGEFALAMENLNAAQTIPAGVKPVESPRREDNATIYAYAPRPAPAMAAPSYTVPPSTGVPSIPVPPAEQPGRVMKPWYWAVIGGVVGLGCLAVAAIGIVYLFSRQKSPASPVVPPAPHASATFTQPETVSLTPTPTLPSTETDTPAPTQTPTFTETPAPTETPTPAKPQLLADKNYLCLVGPAKTYKHAVDVYAGSIHDIIGRSQNNPGWYKLAVNQANTHYTCCWIGGGKIQGNINLVPYTETLCQ